MKLSSLKYRVLSHSNTLIIKTILKIVIICLMITGTLIAVNGAPDYSYSFTCSVCNGPFRYATGVDSTSIKDIYGVDSIPGLSSSLKEVYGTGVYYDNNKNICSTCVDNIA